MAGLEVTNFVLGLTTGAGRLVVDAAHHARDKHRCALINADQVSHDTILFNFHPYDKDFFCTLELIFRVQQKNHQDAANDNDGDSDSKDEVRKYMKEQSDRAKRDNLVIEKHNQDVTSKIQTLEDQLTNTTDGTLYSAILQHMNQLKSQKLLSKVVRSSFDDHAVNQFARQRFVESGEVETLVYLMAGERLKDDDVDVALDKFIQTIRQRGFNCHLDGGASVIKRFRPNIPIQRTIVVTSVNTTSRPKPILFQNVTSSLGIGKNTFDPIAQAQVLTDELVNDLVEIRNRQKELQE